jgi:hypothetical protein
MIAHVAMALVKNLIEKLKHLRTIHKICEHLSKRDRLVSNRHLPKTRQIPYDPDEHQCMECPGWEMSDYGKVRRGCYADAVEYLNIMKYGNPWGKKYKHSRRNWPRMTIEEMRKEDVRTAKRRKR